MRRYRTFCAALVVWMGSGFPAAAETVEAPRPRATSGSPAAVPAGEEAQARQPRRATSGHDVRTATSRKPVGRPRGRPTGQPRGTVQADLEAAVTARRKPRRSKLSTAAWAMVASTAALLTTAGIFGLKMQDCADGMRRLAILVDPYTDTRLAYQGAYREDFERYERQGELYEKLTWAFAGLAAASAAAAATLFVLDHLRGRGQARGERARARIQVLPATDGGALSVEVAF